MTEKMKNLNFSAIKLFSKNISLFIKEYYYIV